MGGINSGLQVGACTPAGPKSKTLLFQTMEHDSLFSFEVASLLPL